MPPRFGVPPQGVPPQYALPPQDVPSRDVPPQGMPYGTAPQAGGETAALGGYGAPPAGDPGYGGDPTVAYPPTGPYAGQQYPAGPGYQGGQPYPAQPFAGQQYPGQPFVGQPWAHGPVGDAAFGGQSVPPRRTRRWLTVAVAASVVAVLGVAGGAYAFFGRHDSTPGPDHYVPADAVAMVSVDLDPPTGQKVAALRFFGSFPQLAKHGASDNLIDGVVRSALDGTSALDDFDHDIRPWLGMRAGLAADPQGGKTHPLLVVEVTDQAKARAGLDHLSKDADDIGYTFVDKYVLISDSTQVAKQAATDAKEAPLDASKQYSHDIATLDDERVATAWFDLERLTDLASDFHTLSGADLLLASRNSKGRVALELRFGKDHAELLGRQFDAPAMSTKTVGEDVEKLPGDTAVAVGVTGLDDAVSKSFDALHDSGLAGPLSELENQTGLSLPDDIAALLGGKTLFAAKGDLSDFGLITSADKDTAQQTADKLLSALGQKAPDLTVHDAGGHTILATSEEYAAALAKGGKLGEQEAFRTAVPDAAHASAVAYVDLRRVFDATGADVPPAAKPIRAIGITSTSDGSTNTVRLRVVIH